MSEDSAADAETAFYRAFADGQLDDMMSIWAPHDDIVCIHPLGPRLEGRAPIADSWRQILANEAPRQFEVTIVTRYTDDNVSTHIVEEQILIPGSEVRVRPVMATNIYQRIESRWFMVAHLASIDVSEEQIETDTSSPQTRH